MEGWLLEVEKLERKIDISRGQWQYGGGWLRCDHLIKEFISNLLILKMEWGTLQKGSCESENIYQYQRTESCIMQFCSCLKCLNAWLTKLLLGLSLLLSFSNFSSYNFCNYISSSLARCSSAINLWSTLCPKYVQSFTTHSDIVPYVLSGYDTRTYSSIH